MKLEAPLTLPNPPARSGTSTRAVLWDLDGTLIDTAEVEKTIDSHYEKDRLRRLDRRSRLAVKS